MCAATTDYIITTALQLQLQTNLDLFVELFYYIVLRHVHLTEMLLLLRTNDASSSIVQCCLIRMLRDSLYRMTVQLLLLLLVGGVTTVSRLRSVFAQQHL